MKASLRILISAAGDRHCRFPHLRPTTSHRSSSISPSKRCRSRSAPAGICAATSATISRSMRDGNFDYPDLRSDDRHLRLGGLRLPHRWATKSPGAPASATISRTCSAPTSRSTASARTSTAPRRARRPACSVSGLARNGLPLGRQRRPRRRSASMVNGYVDLGTYVGFTPYVGGGLGYTYVDWGSLSDSVFCVAGRGLSGVACWPHSEHDGDQSWRFTYAADGRPCLRRLDESEGRPRLSLSAHRRRRRCSASTRRRLRRAPPDARARIPASRRTRSGSACATRSGRRHSSE